MLFMGINLLRAHLMSECGLPAVLHLDTCWDDIVRVGWTLKFYEESGFAYCIDFSMLVFVVDVGIGLALSVIRCGLRK